MNYIYIYLLMASLFMVLLENKIINDTGQDAVWASGIKRYFVWLVYLMSAYLAAESLLKKVGYHYYFRTDSSAQVIKCFWMIAVMITFPLITRKLYKKAKRKWAVYVVCWLFSIMALVLSVLEVRYYRHSPVMIGILLCVISYVSAYTYIKKTAAIRKVNTADIIGLFIFSVLYVCVSQHLVSPLTKIRLDFLLVNILLIFTVLMLLLFLLGHWNITILVATIMGGVWTFIHYLYYASYETVITPTTLGAIGNLFYDHALAGWHAPREIWPFAFFVFLSIVIAACAGNKTFFSKQWVCRVAGMMVSLLVFWSINAVNWTAISGYKFDFYNLKNNYNVLGVHYGFCKMNSFTDVKKPKGYSNRNVKTVLKDYEEEQELEESKQVKPNIIVILNSCFVDFSELGDYTVSKDYLPFTRSANEKPNTKAGKVLVSQYGSYTGGSEYEFLYERSEEYTPLLFPFVTEVKSGDASLVSTLKNQGYHTIATYPGDGTIINRKQKYQQIGFDDIYFKEAYPEPEYIRKRFISDRDIYQNISNWMTTQKEGQSQFIYAVTNQNEGWYDWWSPLRVGEQFPIVCTSIGNTGLHQCMSLMYESDTAFKEFVDTVDTWSEPTIVVMFGGQWDYRMEYIFKDLKKNGYANVDTQQTIRTTPYIVHANYDVDLSQFGDYFSLNYMAANLLQTSGSKMTAYDRYLLDMEKQIPLLNMNGYMDENGVWRETSDISKLTAGDTVTPSLNPQSTNSYESKIAEYNMIQYHARFGKRNRRYYQIK